MRDPYPYSSYESDVGAIESNVLTVYPGWNVWQVWQVNDLPFSLMTLGISRDRQLKIWVEDSIRLGAPGALVADSIDLKGGQVEVLNGAPVGLETDQRKEQVSGPAMTVSGKATLRTVRFFNRGNKAVMAWPHDKSYLLERTYVPSPNVPITAGPGPTTIPQTVVQGAIEPAKDLLGSVPSLIYLGGALGLGLYLFRKELFESGKRRVQQFRDSGRRRSQS